MSFVTGFAQGFSESVQSAIEEEQKSMDDLFKTQFSVRLKRRVDDLSKDRDNLAEAAKHMQEYRNLVPDNDLFKAAQLYKGAGGNHTSYLKRLTDIRNAGGDLNTMLQYTEGSFGEATLQDITRSLVAAPLPEAGQQFDVPVVTQMGKLLTPSELRQASREQIAIDAGKQNLELAEAMMPGQLTLQAQEVTAGISTQKLADSTHKARVALANDGSALKKLELKSKEYDVHNIMGLGRQEALLQIEKLKTQIDRINNPADLEDMQAVVTGNIFKVQEKLRNTDPDNVPETERLKAIESSLQRQDLRLTASIGKIGALTGTPSDPLKNFSAANTAYGKALNNELANSKLAGMPGIVLKSTGEGGVTLQFVGDPKGGALEELARVERIAKRNFFFSMADGVNPDGSARFVTEAARRSVELNLGMRDYRRTNSHYVLSQNYSGSQDYFSKNTAIKNQFATGDFRPVTNEKGTEVSSEARLKLIDRITHAFGLSPRTVSMQIDQYQKFTDKQQQP